MNVGERIRSVRESKNLSQGEIEQRTGLLRCYISRVENGHTVPSIETLEKIARALDLKMYQMLYDGDEPPAAVPAEDREDPKSARFLQKLVRLVAVLTPRDRKLLLESLAMMVRRKRQPKSATH